MITDRVSDALTRIRNGQMAQHENIVIPHTKMVESVCRILEQEKLVSFVEVRPSRNGKNQKEIVCGLSYRKSGEPRIRMLKRISRPGLRVYRRAPESLSVRNGLGLQILSTSKGVITEKQAMEKRVGGEVLAELW